MRSSSALASSTLKRWLQVYTTHRNAQAFAIHYHASHLRFNVIMTWRIQLRSKLKLIKQAKVAEKTVVWRKWIEKVKQRKRERSLKEFENRVVTRCFQGDLSDILRWNISITDMVLVRMADPDAATTGAQTCRIHH